jgi:hypothetical protein
MNVFDTNTRDSMNSVLMTAKIPFLKTDCLDFAVKCECRRFVALPSIQDVITKMWYRKIVHKTGSSFKLKARFYYTSSSLRILKNLLFFSFCYLSYLSDFYRHF